MRDQDVSRRITGDRNNVIAAKDPAALPAGNAVVT
jgi:hypothetical protein